MYQNIKQQFKNPSAEYSAAPFWFWNDSLQFEHLEMQLKEMHEKGIYEFIIHARKGMEIEYLSDGWFDRIGFVLDKSKELGMKVWIYDEDNWPSGYAGGRVVQSNPDFKAKCLSREKIIPVIGEQINIKDVPDSKLIGVVAVYSNKEFIDLTDYENGSYKSWASQEYCWEVFAFRQHYGSHSPAYSREKYVDLLNKKTTEKFIELTHNEYKKRFPDHWGSSIKGFFTDEPGFYGNYIELGMDINTIPWTDDFPAYFLTKKGYNIIQFLAAVWEDMGDVSRKVKHDYYEVLSEMYMENFFKPIYDFCVQDGLESIGHVHREENLRHIVRMEGHFFQTMRYLSVPGIDKISRERDRITEKLVSSAAHIFNRNRSLSETYGCYGWDLTLEEMKAEADWQYVQGVNMLVPHAFFSSIEGERLSESPPSGFFQNYYWKYYKRFSDYISRLSYILSQGSHICQTLVYYPITSCWEKIEPLEHSHVEYVDKIFKEVSLGLLKRQIDFDYIDDYALEERASINSNLIHINNECYRVIIVPFIYNIPLKTLELLVEFVEAGGLLVSIDGIPSKGISAEQDERAAELIKRLAKCDGYYYFKHVAITDIFSLYKSYNIIDLELDESDERIKYLHRKISEKQDAYFIINESENEVVHNIKLQCIGTVEEWNPQTGEVSPMIYNTVKGETSIELSIGGYGSKLIMFTREKLHIEDEWVIEIDGKTVVSSLKSWSQLGYREYSGFVRYKKEFTFDRIESGKIMLDLGNVKDCAEVYLNGDLLDIMVWRPYRLDITDRIKQGSNLLEVVVSNTLANVLEGRDIPSGLLGPVEISFVN